MVDSGYHPIKHHPLRIVLWWWVDSGYHPLKHHPLSAWMVDSGLSIILLG